MKNTITKTNIFFILELVCRYLLLPLSLILFSAFVGVHFFHKSSLSANAIYFLAIVIIFAGIFCFTYQYLHNNILMKMMYKTEKKTVEHYFPYETVFYTQQYRLYINTNGNLGLITLLNPRQFQIIHSAEIQDCYIDVQYLSKDTVKGVRFALKIQDKILYFPTFQTYHAFAADSDAVKNAIAKANYYVALIKKAQKNAISLS